MYSIRTPHLALLTLSTALAMAANLGLAQSTAFTYQGSLEEGGSPVSGNFDLQFTIYDLGAGGSVVAGPITNAPVEVSNGVFTVMLDFGANVFDGNDRWLEIGVTTNGGGGFAVLSPRQPITATPYAVRAANAATSEAVSGSVDAAQLTGTISSNNIGTGTITSLMLADGAVGPDQLANGAVTAEKISTTNDWFLTQSISNPTPAVSDSFGDIVTGVGPDKVIIGAPRDNTGVTDAGAAYLYSIDGKLLTTFTNPTPELLEYFGDAVAGVGSDKVIIGAPRDGTGADTTGEAYLYRTDGTLLTTFTNPTPEAFDLFGEAVASVGLDKVIIGASEDNTGATGAGAAYLFSTNGTLITTYTNPTPEETDLFGFAVAGVGPDKVIVGALLDNTGADAAGSAYLFGTDGTLLTTFTNPTPEFNEGFGIAVAGVGPDKVIIGANLDNTGAADSGAAYLYHTDGTLLTMFTNPTPDVDDRFGEVVAGVGSDKVIIGAPRDKTGADSAGEAYLYRIDGTLLSVFTNANPESFDNFAGAVAGVGRDKVIIGAPRDNTGAGNAGAAYVFELLDYAPDLRVRDVVPGGISAEQLASSAVGTEQLAPGAVTADKVSDLDASSVTVGTLDDARLSPNVALRDANQTFTGANVFDNASGNFSGDGSGLTGLSASEISSGILPGARLSGTYSSTVTFDNAGNDFTGVFRSDAFDFAGAPGFTWSADSDTGMFRSGTDELALTTAGTERFNITAQGNVSIGMPGGSNDGSLHVQNNSGASRPIKCDRVDSDGQLLAWARDDGVIGSVTVAGGVVSYNAFTGSHYAWSESEPGPGVLMRLTGENRRLHGVEEGEVVYGVEVSNRANDPATLGAYLATEAVEATDRVESVRLVSAVGNGELWVADTGRDIQPGDLLISSDVTGCVMLDDPERYSVGHIVARAAQAVRWDEVEAGADGIRRQRLSVLFDPFTRGIGQREVQAVHESLRQKDAEIAELKRRLERLEGHLSARLDETEPLVAR